MKKSDLNKLANELLVEIENIQFSNPNTVFEYINEFKNIVNQNPHFFSPFILEDIDKFKNDFRMAIYKRDSILWNNTKSSFKINVEELKNNKYPDS